MMPEATLNDLSLRIGGLAAKTESIQEAVNRIHDNQAKMLEHIVDTMVSTEKFNEYRERLHDRFQNIHTTIANIDDDNDKTSNHLDRLEKDLALRIDAHMLKTENLIQAIQLQYEHRLQIVERQQNEWKGSLRATHGMAFFLATFVGSLFGYVGEIIFKIMTK